ncbi:RluA family pseudouridine synthase [candidate division KSB1 bacterium]|nr:MAG: RluA family pseudouridine synthase [candidate division KSB1 bacterium]
MPLPPPNPKPFLLTTALGQQRLRIDRFLQQALPSISRHKVCELIESGLVLIDGKIPKKSHKVGPGETIEIFFRDQPPSDILPESIPLEILYEDASLLIVNKPQGMVTHPAHGHFSGTLVNALMHHLGMQQAGETIRPGIVHRLDKGTSGLLVVAKNEIAHRKLTEQFASRQVHRLYTALVWGRFRKTEDIIDAPLGRHPGDRKRFAVVRRGGKTAITTFKVTEIFRETSVLTLKLGTGRTHQIRAHLEHEGHPVFGDATYGGRLKRLAGLAGARKKMYTELLETLPDVALHAKVLGFIHPETGQKLEFSVPIPDNFSNILNLLREDACKTLDNV